MNITSVLIVVLWTFVTEKVILERWRFRSEKITKIYSKSLSLNVSFSLLLVGFCMYTTQESPCMVQKKWMKTFRIEKIILTKKQWKLNLIRKLNGTETTWNRGQLDICKYLFSKILFKVVSHFEILFHIFLVFFSYVIFYFKSLFWHIFPSQNAISKIFCAIAGVVYFMFSSPAFPYRRVKKEKELNCIIIGSESGFGR